MMRQDQWLPDHTIETLVRNLHDFATVHNWNPEAMVEYILYKVCRTDQTFQNVGLADFRLVFKALGRDDSSLPQVLESLESKGIASKRFPANWKTGEIGTNWHMDIASAIRYEATHGAAVATEDEAKKRERQIPRQEGSSMAKKQVDQNNDKRKVFVVHGRNNAARDALFTFLRAIGLHPLEWSEIVQATGKASPYIGEVLEKGFSIAQAVVVLMTPDDEARLREAYRGTAEPAHETELTPQPRPNVLLEGGMALGLFPDRTVIVELGTLRPVSDIGGRHVIRMNDTSERRHELAQRLETAGCEVNTTGTDWYKAGSFASSV